MQLDDASTQPAEPAPAKPLWRRRPAQIAAVLIAAGAALAIGLTAAAGSSPAAVHVRGTLNLGLTAAVDMNNTDPLHPVAGDACESAGGYSDITPGAAVTVGGPSGQTLGVGSLAAGVETAGGYCAFSFDVPVPGGQSLYTVTISHRGTQTFTPVQAEGPVALTLGS